MRIVSSSVSVELGWCCPAGLRQFEEGELVLERKVEWVARDVRRGNSQAQLPHHPEVVVEDAFELGVGCSLINLLPHSLEPASQKRSSG